MSRVVENLTSVLQETKSVRVLPNKDVELGGPFVVANQAGAALAYLDTEQQANEWVRENVRGKSWFVGQNDTTLDRGQPENPGKPTDLRTNVKQVG